MLLSPFKDQVIRGGRRRGWNVMVFGMHGPVHVTLCVPQLLVVHWGCGIPAWPWQRWEDLSLGGPQELSQATRTTTSHWWGKCPRNWLAVTWAVERDKTGCRQVWLSEGELAVGRCHFSPCHLANNYLADAQAPHALTGAGECHLLTANDFCVTECFLVVSL